MATLGELVSIPEHDIIHVFNNEAMLAVSHAIEDLASEQRQGELISTFQLLENFKPQKKRYVGLSKDLDAVRVWGAGQTPKGCSRIDFIPIFRPELSKYWIVLFASPKANAVLVCRQVNESDTFQKKVFAGFYSFNPFLVESIKRQFNLMSCGLDHVVNQWEKDYHFASPCLKEIDRYFKVPVS
ncbi:MAG: DICT sensory domain-containing protein [Blastochloris sp.]|nr:DICT sensory domain-containing protein [Blastochloris sp.]